MKLGGKKHEALMEHSYDVEDAGYALTRATDEGDIVGMLSAFNELVDALHKFGEAVAPIAVKELLG